MSEDVHSSISKGNRYLRQSGCSFSFSVPCVREIEKVNSEKVKTKPKYRNVTRFRKQFRKARLRSFASQLW